MTAVAGSGIKIMSDSLMPFQPAMDEPSNIFPSLKNPSSTSRVGTVTCCSLPIVSVNRRSANFASFSLINFNTSAGVIGVLANCGLLLPGRRRCLFQQGVRRRRRADEPLLICSELIDALQCKACLAVCKNSGFVRGGGLCPHEN